MDRLFGIEYVQGYTAAIQDVIQTLESIQTDLKFHKRRQNFKTYKEILECILKHRAILREEPDAFVRCAANGGYEMYITHKGVVDEYGRVSEGKGKESGAEKKEQA